MCEMSLKLFVYTFGKSIDKITIAKFSIDSVA